jgi:hypothetical protein
MYVGTDTFDPVEIAKSASASWSDDPGTFNRPDIKHKYIIEVQLPGSPNKPHTILRGFSTETNNPEASFPIQFVNRWGHIPINEWELDRIRKTLTPLGKGRTREVFEKRGVAVKYALSDAGRTANRAEASLFRESPDYLNPVLEHAEDYSWLKQPKLLVLPDQELAQRVGLGKGQRFQTAMTNLITGNHAALPRGNPQWDEFERAMHFLMQRVPGLEDVERANQWGIRPDGRMVVIDYGQQDLAAAARSPKQVQLFLKQPPWVHHVAPKREAPSTSRQGLLPKERGANANLPYRTDRGSWRPVTALLPPDTIPQPLKSITPEQLRLLIRMLGLDGSRAEITVRASRSQASSISSPTAVALKTPYDADAPRGPFQRNG